MWGGCEGEVGIGRAGDDSGATPCPRGLVATATLRAARAQARDEWMVLDADLPDWSAAGFQC